MEFKRGDKVKIKTYPPVPSYIGMSPEWIIVEKGFNNDGQPSEDTYVLFRNDGVKDFFETKHYNLLESSDQ